MANKTRLTLAITEKKLDSLLSSYEAHTLVEQFMNDPRVPALYEHLKELHLHVYPKTMPLVNQHRKAEFFKSYEVFQKRLRAYLKRELGELVLEEYANTLDVNKAKKQISAKAPQFFEQRLCFIYEEMSYQLKTDKIFNGEKPTVWM